MDFMPFLESLRFQRNYSPQTVRAYSYDLAKFDRFLTSRDVVDVTAINHPLIAAYIRELKESPTGRFGRNGLSDATIARRLAAISGFLDYTRVTTVSELRNPVKDLKRRQHKNNGPKPVDEEVLEQLLAGVSVTRDLVIISLYLATGLRLNELRSLDRGTIRFELTVDETGIERLLGTGEVMGKGSKLRRFYVDRQTLQVYATYLSTRSDNNPALFLSERRTRISARAIQYTLTTWCDRLGLPRISPHRLRHSFATRMANARIDEKDLMDLMGHASFTTTRGYFKIYDQVLAQSYFAAAEAFRNHGMQGG
jgi:integrase/recombinase XerC